MQKMKFLLVCVLVTCLFSCEQTDYLLESKLRGVWLLQSRDGQNVATNDRNSVEFKESNLETFGQLYTNGEGYSSKWIECVDYFWKLTGKNIQVVGTNAQGIELDLLLKLNVVDDYEMSYTSTNKVEDGQVTQNSSYTYKRVDANREPYLGTWLYLEKDGVAMTDKRITFNTDTTFIVEKNVSNVWSKEVDGDWYSYGNFIALNLHGSINIAEMYDIDIASSAGVTSMILSNSNGNGAVNTSYILRKQ